MTTVVEALQTATGELHDAAALLQTLAGQIQANLTATTANTTTIINNFLGRPPVQTLWVDPVNGDDTKDGTTAAKAKKSLDGVIAGIGTTATQINLLGDATIRRMNNLYASLTILGVQPANNSSGFIYANRQLTFLGTAENSPSAPPNNSTYPSGFFLYAPNLIFQNIDFVLPAQPAGQSFRSHIIGNIGGNVFATQANLLVANAQAGALIGSNGNTLNASLSVTLGTGAAGHLFDRIAAGGNPNNDFGYKTNVTSA